MYNNIATNDGSKERVLTYIWVLEMPSLYRVMCQASILRLICKCSTFINIDWVLHTIPVLFEKAQASGIFFLSKSFVHGGLVSSISVETGKRGLQSM